MIFFQIGPSVRELRSFKGIHFLYVKKLLSQRVCYTPFDRKCQVEKAGGNISGDSGKDRAGGIGMTEWLATAKQMGFDAAAPLDPKTLIAREDVRAMCAADKCGAYNKNWTCPPAIGTIESCQQKMRQYKRGILLQSIGHMRKSIDSKCYQETERLHIKNFDAFAMELRKEYPNALCLGTGGCRVCGQCAYPAPCRFPEKAMSSMEGYGLFVTQVCRDAGIPYHHGAKTITYTACILI